MSRIFLKDFGHCRMGPQAADVACGAGFDAGNTPDACCVTTLAPPRRALSCCFVTVSHT